MNKVDPADVIKFARDQLGVTLLPQQIWLINALTEGKEVYIARRAGTTTATSIWRQYIMKGMQRAISGPETYCMHAVAVAECNLCYPVYLRMTTVREALDALEKSNA